VLTQNKNAAKKKLEGSKKGKAKNGKVKNQRRNLKEKKSED